MTIMAMMVSKLESKPDEYKVSFENAEPMKFLTINEVKEILLSTDFINPDEINNDTRYLYDKTDEWIWWYQEGQWLRTDANPYGDLRIHAALANGQLYQEIATPGEIDART